MVPAFAVGMGDLQKRVEAQTKTSEAHKAKLVVGDRLLFTYRCKPLKCFLAGNT